MIVCSYTFPWAHYKTPQDADLTARWFATWVRLSKAELSCRTSEDGPVVTTSPRAEYTDFTRSLGDRALAGEKLSATVPPPLQGAAAAGQLPEQVAPERQDEGFILDPSTIDWDRIDTSAWEDTPRRLEPDDKILLMMKQGTVREIIPDIQAIPDATIRVRLLSLLYYLAEFEFASRFSYYIPRRLLTGNSIDNVQNWTKSAPDLIAARSQLLEALLYYVADHSNVQLQAMSSTAAAALGAPQASACQQSE